jgi:hypothetical protein
MRCRALMAPSPMTATVRRAVVVRAAAIAMPKAALSDVLECPTRSQLSTYPTLPVATQKN